MVWWDVGRGVVWRGRVCGGIRICMCACLSVYMCICVCTLYMCVDVVCVQVCTINHSDTRLNTFIDKY